MKSRLRGMLAPLSNASQICEWRALAPFVFCKWTQTLIMLILEMILHLFSFGERGSFWITKSSIQLTKNYRNLLTFLFKSLTSRSITYLCNLSRLSFEMSCNYSNLNRSFKILFIIMRSTSSNFLNLSILKLNLNSFDY